MKVTYDTCRIDTFGTPAFRLDVPEAEIHFVDSGHLALESHVAEIAALMIPFLKDKRE